MRRRGVFGSLAREAGTRLGRVGWTLKRAYGFACYGVASLALGWLVIPLVSWRARRAGESPDEIEVRAQHWIHRTTRAYLAHLRWLGVLRNSQQGAERLAERPLLIVANHPSLLDTPMLTEHLPQADFVVSSAWTRNPFLARTVKAAGYLRAERGPLVVRDAVRRMRAGRSVVMYPEGSRTPIEGLRDFQSGAAHVALRVGCDIVPVVLRVRPCALMKGQGFLDYPRDPPEWQVEVGEPVRLDEHRLPGENRSETVRRITAALQDHFEKRWDRGSC